MLFVILLILLILGRKWLLDRRRKKLMGEDANATVLYAYICHRRLKPWGGQDSGELTALAEKARFSISSPKPSGRRPFASCGRRPGGSMPPSPAGRSHSSL